jgi:hypothetical protein
MTGTAVAERLGELKTALREKIEFINEGVDKGIKIDGNTLEVKSEDWAALTKARDEAKDIQSAIDVIQYGKETKDWLDTPVTESAALAGAAMQAGLSKYGNKTLGELFTESDEFKTMRQGNRVNSEPFEVKDVYLDQLGGGYGVKDVYAGMTGALPSTPRALGSIQFDPIVPRPQRTFRVRDLFPAAGTSASLIDYFRVTGFANDPDNADQSGAASVPDRDGNAFALKPQSKLQFESKQAPVRTIAHWEAAHRNVLDDVPQLRATIDNELLYGLRLEEDRQILNGSGNNDELLGILLTPNIQTYAQVSGDQKADALRRAATRVLIANYQATGFVLNPFDWEDVELQKAVGDGQYMLVTNVAIGAQTQVWRQPVVETVAMSEGEFLTGAFGLGAQLYDRQIANVRTSESHADFFIRNAIVILCEERLGLAVKRPEAFVHGTFTGAGGSS